MKIVNRLEFLALPAGTVFSEYEPCCFNGLNIKLESIPDDYFEIGLIGNIDCNDSGEHYEKLLAAEKDGSSIDLDFETCGRNGAFQWDMLYAIYEKEDIEGLVKALRGTIE